MPKVIVIAVGTDATASTLADAVVEGATGVRFTEVDVRSVNSDAGEGATQPTRSRVKPLESTEQLADYDGIVIVGATADDGAPGAARLMEQLAAGASDHGYPNAVFGLLAGDASLLASVASLGGIIVSEPRGSGDSIGRAKALGARVAKVAEWVRHALSHEQQDRTAHKEHVHHHH